MTDPQFDKLPRKELLKRLTRTQQFIDAMLQEVEQHEGVKDSAPQTGYPRGYLHAMRSVKERLGAAY